MHSTKTPLMRYSDSTASRGFCLLSVFLRIYSLVGLYMGLNSEKLRVLPAPALDEIVVNDHPNGRGGGVVEH